MSDKTRPPALRVGGVMQSIIPQSVDEAYRLSKMAYVANLLKPQRMKVDGQWVNEDADATVARGTMQILQGLDIGMPPMQALQLLALIGNRIVAHSEGIPALLWSKGFKLEEWTEGEGDDRTAHCKIIRPDGTVIERTFSVAQAKKAKLWSPNEKIKGWKKDDAERDNDSAWHRFDFRMLQHRARGYAASDGAADALRGIGVKEMVEDGYMIDVTPPDGEKKAVLDLPDKVEAKPPGSAEVPEHVSEAENNQDPPITNVEQYLKALEENLTASFKATDHKAFQETWDGHVELFEAGKLSRSDHNKAEAIHDTLKKHLDLMPAKAATAELPLGDPPPKGKKGK